MSSSGFNPRDIELTKRNPKNDIETNVDSENVPLLPGHTSSRNNNSLPIDGTWEEVHASYQVLVVDSKFNLNNHEAINALPILNAAYIRQNDDVYYLNKLQGHFHKLPKLTREKLLRLNWNEQPNEKYELFISKVIPNQDTLNSLPIENAGYVRTPSGFYAVNKATGLCELIGLHDIKRAQLELELGIQFTSKGEVSKTQSRLKTLTKEQLTSIADLTDRHSLNRKLSAAEVKILIEESGFDPRPRRQRYLEKLGYLASIIFAVGCGVSTAAAFITAGVVSGPILPFIIAGILFSAGTGANWWIFKRYVPPVLIDFFGKGKLFKSLREKEDGTPLPWSKIGLMGLAFTLSLSVGITFAALTFMSTFTLSTAFTFMAGATAFFPPVAIILASVTLICMTSLMIKDIAELFRKENVLGECAKFLKNLVSTDRNLPQNKGKSDRRIICERVLTVGLTALFLPIALMGLYLTMNACAPGVKAILMKFIPGAAETLSKVIAMGFAFIGQIPFGAQTTFQTTSKICGPAQSSDPDLIISPMSNKQMAIRGFKLSNIFGNATGNGFIPMMGAEGLPQKIMAMISGFLNSMLAGVPAVLVSDYLYREAKTPERSLIYRILSGSKEEPVKSAKVAPIPEELNLGAETENQQRYLGKLAQKKVQFQASHDLIEARFKTAQAARQNLLSTFGEFEPPRNPELNHPKTKVESSARQRDLASERRAREIEALKEAAKQFNSDRFKAVLRNLPHSQPRDEAISTNYAEGVERVDFEEEEKEPFLASYEASSSTDDLRNLSKSSSAHRSSSSLFHHPDNLPRAADDIPVRYNSSYQR